MEIGHDLTISFVAGGQGCYFTVGLGNLFVVTTPVMPADRRFCANALSEAATILGIPEGECAELWKKLSSALQNRGQRKE